MEGGSIGPPGVAAGTGAATVVLVTRTLLDRAERLTAREMGCGLLTLVGITMIAQPAALFGAADPGGPRVGAVGLCVATIAGGLAACVGVLTRLLSQAGGSHDGYASPPTLLSNLCAMASTAHRTRDLHTAHA